MKKTAIDQQNGFTLVEVIISIAVLGLVCAIVLKLFVLSNTISEQSRIEDVASIYAMNVIEVCKSEQSLQETAQNPFFKDARIKNNEKSRLSGEFLYDKNWQTISAETIQSEMVPVFKLEYSMISNDKVSTETSALFDITINVYQLDAKTKLERHVLEYTTSKYFIFKE